MPLTTLWIFNQLVDFKSQLALLYILKVHTTPHPFLSQFCTAHAVQNPICNIGLCFINRWHGLAAASDQEILQINLTIPTPVLRLPLSALGAELQAMPHKKC